ncbi:hypothetical protein B296_00056805 [Ensete ventricosum]|uniref:Uncharacterized protein n=1 Tax=Ensete ventricosum TaxID=4639 RepID=A0A426XND1_ENSVE|nr:hypothetical protein B296_00056805 [Ensete ventricosum]
MGPVSVPTICRYTGTDRGRGPQVPSPLRDALWSFHCCCCYCLRLSSLSSLLSVTSVIVVVVVRNLSRCRRCCP